MKEKIRNIITKWFSHLPVVDLEHILILGPDEALIEELRKTMPEWIMGSALDVYPTWTTKSLEEKKERVQSIISTCLTFCTLSLDEKLLNQKRERGERNDGEEPGPRKESKETGDHLFLENPSIPKEDNRDVNQNEVVGISQPSPGVFSVCEVSLIMKEVLANEIYRHTCAMKRFLTHQKGKERQGRNQQKGNWKGDDSKTHTTANYNDQIIHFSSEGSSVDKNSNEKDSYIKGGVLIRKSKNENLHREGSQEIHEQ